MSKELEALERLYSAGRLDLPYVQSEKHKEDYKQIEKALKALEIIKRYPVEVINLIDTYLTYEEMIEDYCDDEIPFIENKEEFDLLKEVLNNE